jgi:hypothetical protein
MKRERLLRHLRLNGCVLRREGKEHSLWEKPLDWARGSCSSSCGDIEPVGETHLPAVVHPRSPRLTIVLSGCSRKWRANVRRCVTSFGKPR